MKYRYIGNGPYPQHVIGHGVVNASGDVIETDTPINHVHFEIVEDSVVDDVKPDTESKKRKD